MTPTDNPEEAAEPPDRWSYPTSDTTDEPAPPEWEARREPGRWAIVEIMGHRKRAGSISDAQIAGGTMLRIQHPTMPDHDGVGPLSVLLGLSALFCVEYCSRDHAIRIAESYWLSSARELGRPELTAADHDWYDDEDVDVDVDDWHGR